MSDPDWNEKVDRVDDWGACRTVAPGSGGVSYCPRKATPAGIRLSLDEVHAVLGRASGMDRVGHTATPTQRDNECLSVCSAAAEQV